MNHLDYFNKPIEVGDTILRSMPAMLDYTNLKQHVVIRITPKALYITHKRWDNKARGYVDAVLRVQMNDPYYPSKRFINLTKANLV